MLRWYCFIQVLDGLSSWTYFAKQVAYFKALGRDTSIFSQRENNCGNKRRKMPCYNLHRRWNLSINVRDRDLLLVSLYLRFQFFSYLHFFTFCYLSWATLCDVASSDYYESILFHFMSVLAHSKFPQNWQSFWHNDVGR